MQADFSVELAREDPALEVPWSSSDPQLRYVDLKTSPILISQVPEAAQNPELRLFLLRINAPDFPLATAKCDAWPSQEITPEEEIFNAAYKFVSYIDLVFTDETLRLAFERHEQLASELCRMLQNTPEIKAAAEFVIRHCHFHKQAKIEEMPLPATTHTNGTADEAGSSHTGFCITAYVTGYGDGDRQSYQQWSIALALLQYALVQMAHGKLLE